MDVISQSEKIWQVFYQKVSILFPNVLVSVCVLIVGLGIAFLAKMIMVRVIGVIHQRLSIKGVFSPVVKEDSKPASQWLGNVTFWIIIFFTFTLIAEIMGLKVVTDWLGGLTNYLPKIFAAVLVAFLGLAVGRIVRDLVANTAKSAGIAYAEALGKVVYVILITVTVLVILKQLGIEVQIITNAVLILLGAFLFGGALSFSLGAKPVINDILCSYFLQKNYQVGEKVRIGDVEGKIAQITPTSVILDSPTGRVTIPAKMFSDLISTALKAGA